MTESDLPYGTENNPLFHPVKAGSLLIPGNIFLAPTAGFSDRAFREICVDHGASFCFTEMVSCEALVRNSEKTLTLMRRGKNESLLGIQLFASNPESAYKAALAVTGYKPDLIDINCGCPVPKIVKTGAGSALMKTPEKIGEIVSAVKSALSKYGDIPVTVKLRLGWNMEELNYLDCAGIAAGEGASMISLHARTKSQGYSGYADWEHIKILKSKCSLPVIGSGDLYTAEDAERMLSETLCDGIMFARGSFGNPFIFRQTRELLTGGKIKTIPGAGEKINTAVRHLKTAIEYFGERKACKEMKKHLCAYTKGLRGGNELRNRIVHAGSFREYEEIFNDFMEKAESGYP